MSSHYVIAWVDGKTSSVYVVTHPNGQEAYYSERDARGEVGDRLITQFDDLSALHNLPGEKFAVEGALFTRIYGTGAL